LAGDLDYMMKLLAAGRIDPEGNYLNKKLEAGQGDPDKIEKNKVLCLT